MNTQKNRLFKGCLALIFSLLFSGNLFAQTVQHDTLSWTWEVTSTVSTQTKTCELEFDQSLIVDWGDGVVSVNVRIIAATHQNLEKLVSEGKFREDLFYRLNVIRIYLPALKDRKEDIPRLARRFLNNAACELNVDPKILHPDTEKFICSLPWPGNVRQLENVCRWITVMASGQEVLIQDLPPELLLNSDKLEISNSIVEQDNT